VSKGSPSYTSRFHRGGINQYRDRVVDYYSALNLLDAMREKEVSSLGLNEPEEMPHSALGSSEPHTREANETRAAPVATPPRSNGFRGRLRWTEYQRGVKGHRSRVNLRSRVSQPPGHRSR